MRTPSASSIACAGSRTGEAPFYTAFATRRDEAQARDAGFDAFCRKPMNLDELVTTITNLA